MKDYGKLKHMAYQMVVEQGKTQKETAKILGVSVKTVSEWATKNEVAWKNIRKLRQSSANTARENIQRIISMLSEKRLRLEYEINRASELGDQDEELSLRKQAGQISNEMAYNNKALAELNKEKGVSLGQYVDVFDDIFSSLREFDSALFDSTINFQSEHLRKKANELG